MPARIYTDRDANLTPLKKRRVAVIGFGWGQGIVSSCVAHENILPLRHVP